MGDLAASDVTYTMGKRLLLPEGGKLNVVTIAFGDGSLTYPSGGVPLTKGKMGTPNVVQSLKLIDSANDDGFTYKYDPDANTIRIYTSAGFTPAGTVSAPTFTGSALAAHTHDLLLKDSAVADSATTRVNAGADLLGANTGGDITVTGGGANGGVVSASAGTPAGTNSAPTFTGTAVAAAGLSELSGAITAATLVAEVIGY